MDKMDDWIHQITGLNVEVQDRIYLSILIIFVLWLIRFISYKIVCNKTGLQGYALRVLPKHEYFANPFESGMIHWAQAHVLRIEVRMQEVYKGGV